MKTDIMYVGAKAPNERIWGYLRTFDTERWYITRYTAFWGKSIGKLNFQKVIDDGVFQETIKKKKLVYLPLQVDRDVNRKILNEFGQHQLAKELRGSL